MSRWVASLTTLSSVALVAVITFACTERSTPIQPTPQPGVPGTQSEYSLFGIISDGLGRPLSDVRIEVLDGSRAGVSATTDASGRYELPGSFSGAITIRATKDGYVSVTRHHDPSLGQARQTLSFAMAISPSSSVNLAGEYSLTLTAASTCTELPEPARSRTYSATVTPLASTPGQYRGTLSGATFPPTDGSNQFFISVGGDVATIYLGDPYDWTDSILEQLSPTDYVAVWGEGDFPVSDTTISGTLNKYDGFEYCVSSTPPMSFVGIWRYRCPVAHPYCRVGNLTLTRR